MSKTIKQRIHNEWMMPVSRGGRKTCPTCKARLGPGESIWIWGEYVRGKWRAGKDYCKACFAKEVLRPLAAHTSQCGCAIQFCARSGYQLADWITLPEAAPCEAQSS